MSAANNTNGVPALKVPVYSGKKEDFQMWWFQFKAHATLHGYAELMVPTKHSDLPNAFAEGPNDTAAQKKMRDKHTMALCHLLQAMGNRQSSVSYVMKTVTTEWPGGLVHKVVESMLKAHNPKDVAAHLELKVKLQKLSLGPNEDPENLFTEITTIQSEYKNVPEMDLIAAVIGALPQDYKEVMTSLQVSEGNNITFDMVENTVHTHYRTMSVMNSGNSEDREIAMNNADTAGPNPPVIGNPNGNNNPQDWHRLIDQAIPPNGWNHQVGNNQNGNRGWNNQNGIGG